MECIFSANMTFIIYYTAITYITMHKFSVITNATYSTFVTVVISSFHSIIKKIACFAEILCKLNTAIGALIAYCLLVIAFGAYYLLHFEAVYFMGFIFIMTKATCVNFSTARRYKFTITNIMLTAVHF
jgi:hypothetical protein